jgi:hypothetical protein
MSVKASDIDRALLTVERSLGPQSPLAQALTGFAPRPGQIEMAAGGL